MEETKIFVGFIDGIIANEGEFKNCLDELDELSGFFRCDGPKDAFNKVINCLSSGDINESS